MGKGRPRAVEKGVPGHGYSTTTAAAAAAGDFPVVPSAPTFYPTPDEFADPLAYIDKIRPEAERFGICRIVPPPSWSPPFAVDLSSFKFPTKSQSIHRLQARPASCDSQTFDLEYRRFLVSNLGRNPPRRPPIFLNSDLDLCALFNAVKRYGGYKKVCKEKRWGDVFRFVRPRATLTECSKHVLSQIYCDHLCDYEDHVTDAATNSKRSRVYEEIDQARKKKKGDHAGTSLEVEKLDQICEQCKSGLHEDVMLLCDRCDKGWHLYCLSPPIDSVPSGNWYCQECVNSDKDAFGFVPAKKCTLDEFRRMDERVRRKRFGQSRATRAQIEKQFWAIVEGRAGELEVMYGNDLDTSVYGSGFPRFSDTVLASVDQEKWKEYASSPWNLNNLPKLQGSMLPAVRENIAGVMVPWLYIGMLFSSFCWHVEDHCFYSMNYLHWGEPKCWYGVPGAAANSFEEVMRKALPDLFDAQPDLLFQLVTMLNPSVLQENGVPVYSVIQEPGNFVITFPRSFHGGFNLGFNCAEAVNFAPADWLPHGGFGAELYRMYHKEAVLSHEELLCVVTKSGCNSRALPYLKEEMNRILSRERRCRKNAWRKGIVRSSLMPPKKHPEYVGSEEDPTCVICRQFLYLSAITCRCRPSAFVCLEHWRHLCECNPSKHRLLYRHTLGELGDLVRMCSAETEIIKHSEEIRTSGTSDNRRRIPVESNYLTKKVKGRQISYTQLAEDWLLNARCLFETSFSATTCCALLKEAEQFLWADHGMNPIRDMTIRLTEVKKWVYSVGNCLAKLNSFINSHEDSLPKVSLAEVEQLLSFDCVTCYEPLTKLKTYAKDAKMLAAEIEDALMSNVQLNDLELLYTKASKFPICVEETTNLAREISSAKVWLKNASSCLLEKRLDIIDFDFLKKLHSEMMELRVQLPEMKLLSDLCSEVNLWEVRCKEFIMGSSTLKDVEDFLNEAKDITVVIPDLKLLQQYVCDTYSWISCVRDALQDISEQKDHENIVSKLSCLSKSGQLLKFQVEELQIVEAELKRSSCRAKAVKALSVPMPLEFIQHLIAEAFQLGLQNETSFSEISEVLKEATTWEENANNTLSHRSTLMELEHLIRISKNIFVDLPSLPLLKKALSTAQSWISRSQPYLIALQSGIAAGRSVKVNELKELISQSKSLKVTLDTPEKLQSILKGVDEWECSAFSVLQDSEILLYMHNANVRIDDNLTIQIAELLKRIESTTNVGLSMGFEFSELPKLQNATLALHWILKALSFCSRIPSYKEVDCLLEGIRHLPDTFSGNTLTVMLVKGVSCLRKACCIIQQSQNFRNSTVEDAEEILEEIQVVEVAYPLMLDELQHAIAKHNLWLAQARNFFQHPTEQSWSLLLKLKEHGQSEAFRCLELDKLASEVEKVEKWMHQCHSLLQPVVGDPGSVYLELSYMKGTLDRALSIYSSSKGSKLRSFCVCCPDVSGTEDVFTCLTCNDLYHFSCMGPPLATAGTTSEYCCPFCQHIESGSLSKHGGQLLICRGNRPELDSFKQLLALTADFLAGVEERKLLEDIIEMALLCKRRLTEVVDTYFSHRDKDFGAISDSLLCALKAIAVAGIYDHEGSTKLESSLSMNSWKIRVRNLFRGPKKPVIRQIDCLLAEGAALNVLPDDHFMKEMSEVKHTGLQWAILAKEVGSDKGLLELNEVFRLIEEGDRLPVQFEKELKLLKNRSVLYCICRKPYDQRTMIACNQCEEWYHVECIQLHAPLPKMFLCPACKPSNGDIVCLPTSVQYGERLSTSGGPLTPARRDKVKMGLPKKVWIPHKKVQICVDLSNRLRCISEMDSLWRANKKRPQRVTRKRCNIGILSNLSFSTCT